MTKYFKLASFSFWFKGQNKYGLNKRAEVINEWVPTNFYKKRYFQ
jgi:hypothetical protein